MKMQVGQIEYQYNCLNLIRLFAALQVFYGHAVVHLELPESAFITKAFSLLGGVQVFFFISGYLMWKSIDRSPNIIQYFVKRVLRIYPELWCGVVVSLFSIFILYDNIVIRDIGLFTITQSTFMQFWTPNSLRDFGVGTPNGSLWTICVLVQFYIVAWFIKKFMSKHDTFTWWLSLLFVLTLSNVFSPLMQRFLPEILGKLYSQTFIPYLWLFMLGAFVCEYFEKIVPILKKFWYIFVIAFYVVKCFDIDIPGSYNVFASIFSCAFCLGFAYAFPYIQIKHDISYGVYIYHMIVINIALELGFKGNWKIGAVVLIIVGILASLSHFTIGTLMRKKKEKLIN